MEASPVRGSAGQSPLMPSNGTTLTNVDEVKLDKIQFRHHETTVKNTVCWKINDDTVSLATRTYLRDMLKVFSNWEKNGTSFSGFNICKTDHPNKISFVLKTRYHEHKGHIMFDREDPGIVPKLNFETDKGFCPPSTTTNLVSQEEWKTQTPFYVFLNFLLEKQTFCDELQNGKFSTTPFGKLVRDQAYRLSGMIRKAMTNHTLKTYRNGTMRATTGGYRQLTTRKRFLSDDAVPGFPEFPTDSGQQNPSVRLPSIETFSHFRESQETNQSQPGTNITVNTFGGQIPNPCVEHQWQNSHAQIPIASELKLSDMLFPELLQYGSDAMMFPNHVYQQNQEVSYTYPDHSQENFVDQHIPFQQSRPQYSGHPLIINNNSNPDQMIEDIYNEMYNDAQTFARQTY